MATPALADLVASAKLQPCTYLELFCRLHGEIRVAIPGEPTEMYYPCPICSTSCMYTALGMGATTRQLPLWERTWRESYSFQAANDRFWAGSIQRRTEPRRVRRTQAT
jgi:hypothetical protein